MHRTDILETSDSGPAWAVARLQTLRAELDGAASFLDVVRNWSHRTPRLCQLDRSDVTLTTLQAGHLEAVGDVDSRDVHAVAAATRGQRRHAGVCLGGQVVADVTAIVMPGRLPAAAHTALATTRMPLGEVLRPFGMQRHTLTVAIQWHSLIELPDAETPVLRCRARLDLDQVPVALVTETVYGALLEHGASSRTR